MLKPKDAADRIGISAPTLRVGSDTLAPLLSPAAQKATTIAGTATQRRYTDLDVAYFRRAKEFLDSGPTFDQALSALQALDHRVDALVQVQTTMAMAPSRAAQPRFRRTFLNRLLTD